MCVCACVTVLVYCNLVLFYRFSLTVKFLWQNLSNYSRPNFQLKFDARTNCCVSPRTISLRFPNSSPIAHQNGQIPDNIFLQSSTPQHLGLMIMIPTHGCILTQPKPMERNEEMKRGAERRQGSVQN